MTDLLQLSVVVPTYNRLDTLRYVIPSLVAQDLRPDAFEVIVADSQSNDGTAEYLAEVARSLAVPMVTGCRPEAVTGARPAGAGWLAAIDGSTGEVALLPG